MSLQPHQSNVTALRIAANLPSVRIDTFRLIVAGTLVVAVGCGGLFGWAAAAPLHSAVVAGGMLVSKAGRKTVKNTEGGVLSEIRVAEGDRVKAGQVLLKLDPVELQARMDGLVSRQRSDMIEIPRLEAELYSKTSFEIPAALTETQSVPEVAKLIADQKRLFELHMAENAREAELLKQRVTALNTTAATLQDQRHLLTRETGLNEQELAGVQQLYEHGNATKPRLFELQKESAHLTARDRELAGQIAQTNQQSVESTGEAVRRAHDQHEKMQQQIESDKAELVKVNDEIAETANRLANREVRAPLDGVVVGLAALGKGTVLGAGEPIMDIVPDDSGLVVEIHVAPNDIEALQPGLPAKVTLTAYDSRVTAPLEGTVEQVSADRLTDSTTHAPYYLTRISLNGATAHAVGPLRILAGMPVEAHILTAPRTALAYMVGPLTKAYDTAFTQK